MIGSMIFKQPCSCVLVKPLERLYRVVRRLNQSHVTLILWSINIINAVYQPTLVNKQGQYHAKLQWFESWGDWLWQTW